MANPYLYLASQIHAGLDGMARQLKAPPATTAPYGDADIRLPTSLGEALEALQGDSTLVQAFGSAFIHYFTRIKQSELSRYELAEDKDDFQRREYFWASQLPPPGADELAMLEFTAVLRQPNSRLSCQIQLTDALDGLTVDLPATQY
jgi:hypothetical protein